jgi:hypothetical protein
MKLGPFAGLRMLVYLRRTTLALESIAKGITYLVETERNRQVPVSKREPLPTQFGVMDIRAAEELYRARRGEDPYGEV